MNEQKRASASTPKEGAAARIDASARVRTKQKIRKESDVASALLVSDVIEALDGSPSFLSFSGAATDCGPITLLKVLIFSYICGTFSSRKMQRAVVRDPAYQILADGQAVDHALLARFRDRQRADLESAFLKLLTVCQGMGIHRLGKFYLGGVPGVTNGNLKTEARLREEVAFLVDRSVQVDAAEASSFEIEVAPGRQLSDFQRRERRLQLIRAVLPGTIPDGPASGDSVAVAAVSPPVPCAVPPSTDPPAAEAVPVQPRRFRLAYLFRHIRRNMAGYLLLGMLFITAGCLMSVDLSAVGRAKSSRPAAADAAAAHAKYAGWGAVLSVMGCGILGITFISFDLQKHRRWR